MSVISQLCSALHATNDKLINLQVGTSAFKNEISQLRKEVDQRVKEINKNLQEIVKEGVTSKNLALFTELSIEVIQLKQCVQYLNREIGSSKGSPRKLTSIEDKILQPFLNALKESRRAEIHTQVQKIGVGAERLVEVAKKLIEGEKAWAIEKEEGDKINLLVAGSDGKSEKVVVQILPQGLSVFSDAFKGGRKDFSSFQEIINALGKTAAPLQDREMLGKIRDAEKSIMQHSQMDSIYKNKDAVEKAIKALPQADTNCFVLWQDQMKRPQLSLMENGKIVHYYFDFTREPGKLWLRNNGEKISPTTIEEFVKSKNCSTPLQTLVEAAKPIRAALQERTEKRHLYESLQAVQYPNLDEARETANRLVSEMQSGVTYYCLEFDSEKPEEWSKITVTPFEKTTSGFFGTTVEVTEGEPKIFDNVAQFKELSQHLKTMEPLQGLEAQVRKGAEQEKARAEAQQKAQAEVEAQAAKKAEQTKLKDLENQKKIDAKKIEVQGTTLKPYMFKTEDEANKFIAECAAKLRGDKVKGCLAAYAKDGETYISYIDGAGKVFTGQHVKIAMRGENAQALVVNKFLGNSLADLKPRIINDVRNDFHAWQIAFDQTKRAAQDNGYFAQGPNPVKVLEEAQKALGKNAYRAVALHEANNRLVFNYIDAHGTNQTVNLDISLTEKGAQVSFKGSRRLMRLGGREELPFSELLKTVTPRKLEEVEKEIQTRNDAISLIKKLPSFVEVGTFLFGLRQAKGTEQLDTYAGLLGGALDGASAFFVKPGKGGLEAYVAYVKEGKVNTTPIEIVSNGNCRIEGKIWELSKVKSKSPEEMEASWTEFAKTHLAITPMSLKDARIRYENVEKSAVTVKSQPQFQNFRNSDAVKSHFQALEELMPSSVQGAWVIRNEDRSFYQLRPPDKFSSFVISVYDKKDIKDHKVAIDPGTGKLKLGDKLYDDLNQLKQALKLDPKKSYDEIEKLKELRQNRFNELKYQENAFVPKTGLALVKDKLSNFFDADNKPAYAIVQDPYVDSSIQLAWVDQAGKHHARNIDIGKTPGSFVLSGDNTTEKTYPSFEDMRKAECPDAVPFKE